MNNWMNLKSGVCTLLRDHYHFVTARGNHKSHVTAPVDSAFLSKPDLHATNTFTIMCNTKCHLSHAAITFYTVDFVASGITVQVFTQHCPKKARPVWKEVSERKLRLSRRQAVCAGHTVFLAYEPFVWVGLDWMHLEQEPGDLWCRLLRSVVLSSEVHRVLCVYVLACDFFPVHTHSSRKTSVECAICVTVSSFVSFCTQRVLVIAFISFEMELGICYRTFGGFCNKNKYRVTNLVRQYSPFGMLSWAECLNILFLKNSKHLRNVNDSGGR